MIQPLVSVRLATYNHEKYIAKCIESVVMQKTTFPFEVIIAEDGSTDQTRAIVLAYQEQYPDLLRVLPPTENLGLNRTALRLQQASRGKYHALLEGDDYWIDPLKLQRQADLLEAYPEISLCIHNALIIEPSMQAVGLFYETPQPERLDFAQTCNLNIHTSSMMARSAILATLPAWRLEVWCPDLVFRLWCAHHGSLGYIDDILSVYRIHGKSAVAKTRANQRHAYDQVCYVYQKLDEETNFVHTEILQAQIKRKRDEYRHVSHPKLYYLRQPGKLFARLGAYWRVIQRYRTVRERA